MGGSKAKLLLYRPVIEWICGMTYVDFQVQETANGVNGTNGVH